jgi:hypothetical protein
VDSFGRGYSANVCFSPMSELVITDEMFQTLKIEASPAILERTFLLLSWKV